jgi:hypothetical protein
MQQNSKIYEPADGELAGPGTEATDDYIELLVRQIVSEAGGSAAPSIAGTEHGIDLVQEHLDQLRKGAAAQSASPTEALSERSEEVPKVGAVSQADMQPGVSRARPASLVEQTDGAGAATTLTSIEVSPKPRRSSVDDVILEAMSAVGPVTPLPMESRRAARLPKARTRKGRGRLSIVPLAAMLLLGFGCAVIIGQSTSLDIAEVLENYWVDPEADRTEGSEAVLPSALEPAPVALEGLPPGVAPETNRLAQNAPPNSLQAVELPQGDLLSTTRTVKTYRVGADGKIIVGPRAGS